MSNPVMLALDGSAKDERGLAVAAAVVELSGAPLHLVHVTDAPSERLAAQAAFIGVKEALVTGRDVAEKRLARMAARVAGDGGRTVTWAVLEADHVAEALIRHAAERDARVVVMSTRAPGAAGRALRGSVADHVMRECPSPVLLVPPGAAYMGGKQLRFSRVLVPLDGSTLAASALDYMLRLPRGPALEYALLEVVRGDGERPAAAARLEAAAARARAAGAKSVEYDVGVAEAPAPVIVDAVREALIDLIAMSSRGASGLRRLMLGSVAEGVIRASEVPVLLLTPASLAGP